MFYKVVAKCGHVGVGKFIEIEFPTKASNQKEASQKTKKFARVKKQLDSCITSCEEITEEEFHTLVEINRNDPYLKSKCRRHLHNIDGIEERIQTLPSKRMYERTLREERIRVNLLRVKYFNLYQKYGINKLIKEELL